MGEQEEDDLEDGELESGDGQPSSSNTPTISHQESFGTVPTINMSPPSDRPEEGRDEINSGRNPIGTNRIIHITTHFHFRKLNCDFRMWWRRGWRRHASY